jgi:hypothetical protein
VFRNVPQRSRSKIEGVSPPVTLPLIDHLALRVRDVRRSRTFYEQTGFSYDRPKGKNHCVMRRTISAAKKPRRARVG